MDPQFQELAKEITDAVEQRLSGAFEERIKTHVETLEERVATRVEERLSGAFEQRIKKHFDTLEERVKTHIDNFEQRAETRMKMHFETLEEVVKGAAEGYGGNLDRIERELKDLNKKMETTFVDHGAVLTDHSNRIIVLEKRS